MKNIKKLIGRYHFFLLFFMINILLLLFFPDKGWASFSVTAGNLRQMLFIVPPIFILLGLLDVWVKRETMVKYMGNGAGLKGCVIAFIMGSAAAGPLYAAFPFAGVLLKKGVRLTNVFIFIGAWSTTKLPMLLFEGTNLGWTYMLLRLVCNIAGICLISFILGKTISKEEKDRIYKKAGRTF